MDATRPRGVALAMMVLAISLFSGAHVAAASGVVGTGLPSTCTEGAFDSALVGGGSVSFNCGGGSVTIGMTTTKTITIDTTIDGGGLITIDASSLASDTFDVAAGVTLTVQGLAVVNNPSPGAAAISSQGTLIAQGSTFSGSSLGFGIFTDIGSTLSVTDCVFDANADGIFSFGTSIVLGSAFSSAGFGIRQDSLSGGTTVTNSTVSGGTFGIWDLGGRVTATNCTITGASSRGIEGAPTLTNTIVASNPGGNCGTVVTDNGHNLDDGTSCGFSAIGSLNNTPPRFDPAGLADNGGPTKTIALQASSAAVDGGDQSVCAMTSGMAPVNNRDQRGVSRPGTGHTHCSIGAYEFGFCPTAPAACTGGFAKGIFTVKETPIGKEKLLAKFIKGPALSQTDLGDPLTAGGTAYSLCVYDDIGTLAASVVVNRAGDSTCSGGGTACWSAVGGDPPGGKGYRYKDKDLTADGTFRLQAKGGAAGKSKLLLKGRGPNLPLPIAAHLMSASAATMQLHAHGTSAPACWSLTLTKVVKHAPDFFKAK